MKNKTTVNNFVYFILLSFLFEPTIFIKIPILNVIYICGIVLTFIYCIIRMIKSRIPIDSFVVLLILMRLIILLPTVLYNGDIIKWGYQTIDYVSILLFVAIFYKSCDRNRILFIIKVLFLVYLTINLGFFLVKRNGILASFYGLHFLGIRTRFTDYAFPLCALSLIDFKDNKKFNILCIAVSILNVVSAWIATAILGGAVSIILWRFLEKNKNHSVFKADLFITFGLIITIAVVFLRVQNVFSVFFESFLKRNITLSGRTLIWDSSYDIIKNKWFLGYGYNNDGNFVPIYGMLRQAHNELLQLLYEGRYMCFGCFYNHTL